MSGKQGGGVTWVRRFVTERELWQATRQIVQEAVENARRQEMARQQEELITIIAPALAELGRFESAVNELGVLSSYFTTTQLPRVLRQERWSQLIPLRVGELLAIKARPGGEYADLGWIVEDYGNLLAGVLACVESKDGGQQLKQALGQIAGPDFVARIEQAQAALTHFGPHGPRDSTTRIAQTVEAIHRDGMSWEQLYITVRKCLEASGSPEDRDALAHMDSSWAEGKRGKRLRSLYQKWKRRKTNRAPN